MYLPSTKKRNLVPEDPTTFSSSLGEAPAPNETATGTQVGHSASNITLGAMGLSSRGAAFSTASVLGATLKASKTEREEFLKLQQEKRKLEYQLKMAQVEGKKGKIEVEGLKRRLEEAPLAFEKRLKELEHERDYLFQAVKKWKERAEANEAMILELKEDLAKPAPRMDRDEEYVAELESDYKKLSREVAALQDQLIMTEQEQNGQLEALKSDLRERAETISRLRSDIESITQKYDESQIRLIMAAKQASAEQSVETLQRTMSEKLGELVQLERENRKLHLENEQMRERTRGALIAEERVRDLETRLAVHKQLEQRVASLEAENAMLKEQGTAQRTSSADARNSMEKSLELSRLQEALAELRGQLKVKSSEIEGLKQSSDESKKQIASLQSRLGAKEKELLSAQEQLKLACLEAESLLETGKSRTQLNDSPIEIM